MPGADASAANGEIALPPQPAAVRDARHFVQARLAHLPDDVLGTVTLLVSELATNAVLHAHTPFRVGVQASSGRIRVTVRDENPATPVVKDYGPDAVTGRGMQLVDALATSWGIEPETPGKCVWFEVAASDDLVRTDR